MPAFPSLNSERLILETLKARHARLFYRSLREPAMYRWIPGRPPECLAELKASYRARSRGISPDGKLRYFNWALRRRDGGGYAGRVEATLRRDGTTNLAYIVFKRNRGRGYAREATERMVEYLFGRRDCLQVEAGMDEPNSASWKLAESLGLRQGNAKKGERRYEVKKSGLLARGLELRAAGKLRESRTIMLWLARARPKDARAQYQCAWAHDLLGQEREAVPFYERAIRLGLSAKDLEGAYLGLGSSLRCLGQARLAAGVLGKGAARFPKSRALRVFWSMALLDSGRGREAMGILLRELGETSADPGILRYRRAILGYARDFSGPSKKTR